MKTKKILYSVFALAMAAFTFTACEDVPEPYRIPGQNGASGGAGVTTPAGEGTLENPFNVAAVIDYIQNSETLDQKLYIKGKVSQIKEIDYTSYGNATFYISDDGTTNNEFYVYRCYSLNNEKFKAADEIKVGDEVVIYGNVTIYNGTYETEQNKAYVYSINGNTGEGGGGGTDEPITGDNLLANGDFEAWDGGLPTNWKSTSTASNATLSQSNDAHGGSYSVSVAGEETFNKRIAYKEITLKPGSYKFSFYAKSTTANPAQCRPGYVPVNNGAVDTYVYGEYTSLNNTSWTLVENTFTLNAQTTVCLVVMNPKTSSYATAQDILIDDASLQTSDGGIVGEEGGNEEGGNEEGGSGEGGADITGSLLANGDFEAWEGGLPTNWKSTSTATSATVSQSTEAHGGSYSVLVEGNATANKRIAYKEITLKPGSYKFSFYAKSTTADPSQCRPGYVPVNTDGSVGNYVYGDYQSINNTAWTLVSYDFTLAASTKLCLVVMSPKTSNYATAQDILIDDASLTTTNGGIE